MASNRFSQTRLARSICRVILESVEKLSDTRLWVKKKKLEFSNFKNTKSPYSQVIKLPDHFYKRWIFNLFFPHVAKIKSKLDTNVIIDIYLPILFKLELENLGS